MQFKRSARTQPRNEKIRSGVRYNTIRSDRNDLVILLLLLASILPVCNTRTGELQ